MLHTAAEGGTATEDNKGGGGVLGRVTWGFMISMTISWKLQLFMKVFKLMSFWLQNYHEFV